MPQGAGAEWRAHWPVVLAAFSGMGMSTIAQYTVSLFIEPIEAEFGWTRAQIMSGMILTATVGVLCAPLIGAAIDRFGPRRFGIAASLVVPVCYGLLGATSDNIWVWRALWFVFALSTLLLAPALWTSAITGFFEKGRGFALACVLGGSGFSSIVMPPLAYYAIEQFGWRDGVWRGGPVLVRHHLPAADPVLHQPQRPRPQGRRATGRHMAGHISASCFATSCCRASSCRSPSPGC
jgi:MFS family permease